jgi:hypothetical protein
MVVESTRFRLKDLGRLKTVFKEKEFEAKCFMTLCRDEGSEDVAYISINTCYLADQVTYRLQRS